METNQQNSEPLDEDQTSQEETGLIPPEKVKIDGILFIVWGWIGFLTYFIEYVMHSVPHPYQMSAAKGYFTILLAVIGVIYSLFYIYKKEAMQPSIAGFNYNTCGYPCSLQWCFSTLFNTMYLIK